MKLTAPALAAVLGLPVLAQGAPTPSIWGQVVKVAGGAALVKTVMDIYDWLRGKAVPNPNALHLRAVDLQFQRRRYNPHSGRPGHGTWIHR
jgi:hypothetical protein